MAEPLAPAGLVRAVTRLASEGGQPVRLEGSVAVVHPLGDHQVRGVQVHVGRSVAALAGRAVGVNTRSPGPRRHLANH